MSLDTDGRVFHHACFVTAACFSSPLVQPLVCTVCILVCMHLVVACELM